MGRDFCVFSGISDKHEEGYWGSNGIDFPMKFVSRHNDYISNRIEGAHRSSESLIKAITLLNEELQELTNLLENEENDILKELGERIGEKDLVKLSADLEDAREKWDENSMKLTELEGEIRAKYISEIYKYNKRKIDDLSEAIAVAALLIPMVPVTVRYD